MTTDAGGAMLLRERGLIEAASWEDDGGPPLPTAQTSERLDWAGFLARFYPDSRKHDHVPLAAYVVYREHPA